jgi:YebC/PmpR family DNA-binding regulatory protein
LLPDEHWKNFSPILEGIMAGHSKWANIRHRKGAQDARRGKLFTKLIREITVSAKMGGGDPGANPRLRSAIDSALSNNMPKDTVERAIKRGSGDTEGENYEEIRYEGYGPNGVAVMVECLTDNRNRTVSEVRHAFSKSGGNLGTDGSVAYLFSKTGIMIYPAGSDEDAIMEAALEAGAEDVVANEDGSIEVLTAWEELVNVKEAMIAAGLEPENAEVTMPASTSVDLELEDAQKVMRLIDMLEDLDDVQKVYTNADFSAEVMAQLAG